MVTSAEQLLCRTASWSARVLILLHEPDCLGYLLESGQQPHPIAGQEMRERGSTCGIYQGLLVLTPQPLGICEGLLGSVHFECLRLGSDRSILWR